MSAYRIELNKLVMSADADEQKLLRDLYEEDPDRFDTDDFMYDYFEDYVTNRGLQWSSASETGDLTDAPILAIFDGETERIVQRWAFMDYQVTTPQRQLMERGEAAWEGGNL